MSLVAEAVSSPPVYINSPAAWKRKDMHAETVWTHVLTAEEIAEIDRSITAYEKSGVQLQDIRACPERTPALSARLRELLNDLLHGKGFTVIRGFPSHRYSTVQNAMAFLLIGSHLGSFRSQNAKGDLLGHVRDIGRDIGDANTRFYQTNKKLEYHTDSCDIVGLMCLTTSKSGGESRIASSVAIYNAMMERAPDLAEQLFHAFPTDRRGEIPEGAKPWFDMPVFNWFDDALTTIYVGQYIRSAQALYPQARRLTDKEKQALAMLDALTNDPEFNIEMAFEPGDMQFLHNHQILHSRNDFDDWDDPAKKRHLLRLWVSPPDARALPQCFSTRYGSLEPGNRGGIITKETKLRFSLSAVD